MQVLQHFFFLVARVFIAVIFLFSAGNKIFNWNATLEHLQKIDLQYAPFFLFCAIVLELFGGISLVLGLRTRIGALALILFIIPVTYFMHNFWDLKGNMQHKEMIAFFKNLSLLGGLLYVILVGPGRFSIDEGR